MKLGQNRLAPPDPTPQPRPEFGAGSQLERVAAPLPAGMGEGAGVRGKTGDHTGSPLRFSQVLIIALGLFLAACGGLGGEPRIVATVIPPTPFEANPPPTAPDLVNGAALYAEHCTRCHGVSGAGDGDMVTSGQVTNPGIFTDPATALSQRPTEWFGTITLGRIDKLMPPWGDALTEQQRWDVALYTYTLHYERALLERGAEVWAANCVECHGASGRGDGERAAELTRPVGDLTDPATMVTQSDQVYATIIREGVGENMPAFQNELSAEDIAAVAQYSRALALSGVDALGQPVIPPPVSTEEAPAPNATAEVGSLAAATAEVGATTITISGQITNGSATGTVPADGKRCCSRLTRPSRRRRRARRSARMAATASRLCRTMRPACMW